ncbi:MAG: sigma-E factor negative regulatory protein [Casimicrobiaceae bacterium]
MAQANASGDGFGGASTGPKPEEISQLMDGELDTGRVDDVCAGLRDAGCVATWVCYHVIGDSLRGSATATSGFSERFTQRLAAEPIVLAPQARRPAPAAAALAIAATVAAVSVVGWVALTTMPTAPTALATARQAATVRAADARPPVDNEYVLVHQEYSPTTAIQGVRPYLRAVAASEPDARP